MMLIAVQSADLVVNAIFGVDELKLKVLHNCYECVTHP